MFLSAGLLGSSVERTPVSCCHSLSHNAERQPTTQFLTLTAIVDEQCEHVGVGRVGPHVDGAGLAAHVQLRSNLIAYASAMCKQLAQCRVAVLLRQIGEPLRNRRVALQLEAELNPQIILRAGVAVDERAVAIGIDELAIEAVENVQPFERQLHSLIQLI